MKRKSCALSRSFEALSCSMFPLLTFHTEKSYHISPIYMHNHKREENPGQRIPSWFSCAPVAIKVDYHICMTSPYVWGYTRTHFFLLRARVIAYLTSSTLQAVMRLLLYWPITPTCKDGNVVSWDMVRKVIEARRCRGWTFNSVRVNTRQGCLHVLMPSCVRWLSSRFMTQAWSCRYCEVSEEEEELLYWVRLCVREKKARPVSVPRNNTLFGFQPLPVTMLQCDCG